MTPTSTTANVLTRLQTLRQGGLTEQQISEALGLSLPRVGQLLLFQRWRTWAKNAAVEVDLSERRFRAFWFQFRDAPATQGKRPIRADYEADIFRLIAAAVQAGNAPFKRPKPFRPKTAAELLTAAYPLTALRKEVQRRWSHDMRETFVKLQFALHAHRITYIPSIQAEYARKLKRDITALIELVAGVHPPSHQEVTGLYETEGLKATLDQLWGLRNRDRATWDAPRQAQAAQVVRRTMKAIMWKCGQIDVDMAVDQDRLSWTLRAAPDSADWPYPTRERSSASEAPA